MPPRRGSSPPRVPRLRIDLLRGASKLGQGPALDSLQTLLVPALRTASAAGAVRQVAAPVTGRYVRLVRPGRAQVLSVTEVEVMSRGENVARKGTATQSSIVAGGATGGHAPRAIDGGVDMAASAGKDPLTGTHAFTSPEQDPWWEVDLGSEQPIDVDQSVAGSAGLTHRPLRRRARHESEAGLRQGRDAGSRARRSR